MPKPWQRAIKSDLKQKRPRRTSVVAKRVRLRGRKGKGTRAELPIRAGVKKRETLGRPQRAFLADKRKISREGGGKWIPGTLCQIGVN